MRKILVTLLAVILVASSYSFVHSTAAFAANSSSVTTHSFTATDQPNVLVAPAQGQSVSGQLETRAKSSWPWYITRASGFVAAFALVLLMLSGIGFITGATFRFLEPLTAWATHKAIAVVFGISLLIHGTALLFDKFVPFNIVQVLVPFKSNYHDTTIAGHYVGSLFVAFGVIAMYLVLAIILASYLWIDKKPHLWKAIHFLAYLTMIFVFFHALYLGTDLTHGIFRILWIIAGIGVAVAIFYRLRRRAS